MFITSKSHQSCLLMKLIKNLTSPSRYTHNTATAFKRKNICIFDMYVLN